MTGQAQCIDNETGQLSGGGESGSGSGSGSTSSQSGSSSSSNSNVQGTPQHPTFITGTCEFSDGCNSGCCGFKSGLCAGNIIAQTRDGGCRKKSDGTPSGFNTPENAAKIDGAAGAGGSSTSASTTTTTVAATTSPTTATTVASADCDASCVARRKAGSAFIFDPCSTSSECGAKCCSGGKCRNVLAIATNDPVTGRFDPASGQRKCVGNENGQL